MVLHGENHGGRSGEEGTDCTIVEGVAVGEATSAVDGVAVGGATVVGGATSAVQKSRPQRVFGVRVYISWEYM